MSWEKELDPEERQAWDEFVEHFRRDALGPMKESAMIMQVVPDSDNIDVKFCVELGASIMLDKPIIAIAMPGVELPSKLRLIADEIVEDVDLDTDAGQRAVRDALSRFMERRTA